MLCTNPRFAVSRPRGDGSGKSDVVFDFDLYNRAVAGCMPGVTPLLIPCGHCAACAYNHSRDLANRCMCEYQTVNRGCFVTLTYDDDHLPPGRNLCRRDMVLFLKRFRKALDYDFGVKIRVVYCGEYGSLRGRPHYHMLVYGWSPSNGQLGAPHPSGTEVVYECPYILRCWNKGLISVCPMNEHTICYLSRYTVKKQEFRDYGRKRSDGRYPEFIQAPTRLGLGKEWFFRYWRDVYPVDIFVSLNGKRCAPPKYFDKLLEIYHPTVYNKVIEKRAEQNKLRTRNLSSTAIHSLEIIYSKRLSKLRRSYEEASDGHENLVSR